MAKASVRERAGYRCEDCGATSTKWVGRCPECRAWGSVSELRGHPLAAPTALAGPAQPARPIGEVDVTEAATRPTGVGEFDRVLGGGLVAGSVLLVAGEPGVGKSTLLLTIAARFGGRALYVSGEESAAQVRLRAGRIGALGGQLYLAADNDLAAVLGHIDAVAPELVVVDSVQTLASEEVEGAAGGVAQIREVAATLIRVAKERGIATLLVGHVTKDGSIAGPRVLEHLVDVVVSFEGDRHSRLRMVRTVKNRYGSTDEVGCFDLVDDGLVELADPSGLFLNRGEPAAGTCVTVALEGRRPIVAEVQALVGNSSLPNPRRHASGLDSGRVAMTTAVLERRAGLRVGGFDVYTATVGGIRLADPAADLAVALAIAGSHRDAAPHPGLVALGEVGLAGELRPVRALPLRLAEAARLGFTHALVPPGPVPVTPGIEAVAVADLNAALQWLARARPEPARG